ncbi:DNA primase [Aphelenchoides avenae]|nr:DNA primase [Aphelenchus avenae]
MDIETALRQQFIVFPCQADAFNRQKERGNGTRVFTFESPKFRPGSRKFLATSVVKFWHWYEQCRVPRHFYELIQEGTPCRPYFDLEYYREFNQHLDSQKVLFAFVHLCGEVFADDLGVKLTNRSFLLLDSSTDTKFSVHVTVHLPDGKLFPNNVILKALVDRICTRMSETGVGIVRTEDKDTFLCDTGVYSKNHGKKAPDWRIFLDSLVVPTDYEKFELLDLSALVCTLPGRTLRRVTNTSNNVQRLPLEAYSLRRNDFVDEIAKGNGNSPFPAIDRHILTFLGRFSPNVCVRQWQLLIARTTNSRRLQYELLNCRYCFNIERHHKNQNVYWVVDLERFCYFQKCFDIECRNFISNRFPLPENVAKAAKSRVVSVFAMYKRNSMDDSVEDRRLVGWLQNESRRRSSLASPRGLPVLEEDSFNSSRRDRSLAAHLERRSSVRESRLSAGQQKDSFYDDDVLEYLVEKVADRPDADSFYDLRSDEKFKQFRRSALAKKILLREDSFDNPENDIALAAALVDYTASTY